MQGAGTDAKMDVGLKIHQPIRATPICVNRLFPCTSEIYGNCTLPETPHEGIGGSCAFGPATPGAKSALINATLEHGNPFEITVFVPQLRLWVVNLRMLFTL